VKWLESSGLPSSVTMEFGTLEAIIGGISAGLGISLLPRAVLNKAEVEGRIRIHTIPEPFSRAQTVFITRKDTFVSSALRAFQETLQQGDARKSVIR
jgi:DNA-binding transcriptional LysR family regulator